MDKNKIVEYIREQVSNLKEGESVKLECVSPSLIQTALGEFTGEMDTNGWQADYWNKIDNYIISGTMYYGTATVTLEI